MVGVAHGDDDRSSDQQNAFVQTNLVSNRSDVGAGVVDPNLKNPWGVSAALGGALWVSANGTSAATLYNLANDKPMVQGLVVKPQDNPNDWAPTGQVFNDNSMLFRFRGSTGLPVSAVFIFASEDGRIVAWNPAANGSNGGAIANTVISTPNAVYKGLALGNTGAGTFLFATNFHAGTVDVFDSGFKLMPDLRLVDRNIPSGFAPFGIANIDGLLFVTYAKQDAAKHDDVAGPGNGFVDVFNPNGQLVRRLVSRGPLNSPWAVVRAPLDFGKFSGAFLVGNFGDGKINAFDNNGSFLGALRRTNGQPIAINGLWALIFGRFQGADADDLYFTAGINNEKDGLIGEISVATRKH
ncbi:MAG TPA: TIGR03118 family protein [Kofleriaceae bacterium]|nr:TIGR03118 family protein [Kofleriaceae bacterium]